LSPNHAFADGEGEITVESGDYIPGIPQNQFKTVIDYQLSEGFNIGLDLVNNDKQFLRGDESNQLDQIDGYHVVNVRARYQLNDNLQIFAAVHNVFNEEYETFGLLGEEPGEVEVPIIEDFKVPLFFGAAAPRSGFLGIKYSF
jgi:outer membrane receptor protein involved in Fe transport